MVVKQRGENIEPLETFEVPAPGYYNVKQKANNSSLVDVVAYGESQGSPQGVFSAHRGGTPNFFSMWMFLKIGVPRGIYPPNHPPFNRVSFIIKFIHFGG